MFNFVRGGSPLSPVAGEWKVSDQPDGWVDTDPILHGYYNRNITIAMNVPQGASIVIKMTRGEELLLHTGHNVFLPFATYPAEFTDGYESTPSGFDPALQELQFYETAIIVREAEFYENKPPVKVEVEISFAGAIFKRSYTLSLVWKKWASDKVNAYVQDLQLLGVPYIPEYKQWKLWQPITGEYHYYTDTPKPARVTFDGYHVLCFAEGVEAMFQYSAFAPLETRNQPKVGFQGPESLKVSLDICLTGLEAMQSSPPPKPLSGKPLIINGYHYHLFPHNSGTFIVIGADGGQSVKAYFVEEQVADWQLEQWIISGPRKHASLDIYHDYQNDPDGAGPHRVVLNNLSFWEVLRLEHPAPAWGGTHRGSIPADFIRGVINYLVTYPLWWKRMGGFPNI